MTTAYGDLIVQLTSTTGTGGTLTLTTAVKPYLTAALAGLRDGDTVDWSIIDGQNSESGYGVLSGTQTSLTRNTLLSTNSNSAINLSGNAIVRITPMTRSFQTSSTLTHAHYGGVI